MITRGIVVDTRDNGNKLKIRVPILDGLAGAPGSNSDSDLSWASAVCFSGIRVKYQVNDVVVVGYEDNNIDTPIVLGHLTLLNKEMPSRVEGSFMDLESNALDVNYTVEGTTDVKNLIKADSNGLSIGGLNYGSLTNVETSEVSTIIYDKNSENPNTNWNYTEGIKGGDLIKNKDFSPYDYLRITFFGYDLNFIYLVNLTTKDYRVDDNNKNKYYMGELITDYCYGGGGTNVRPSTGDVETYYSTVLINPEKTNLFHKQCGFIDHTNKRNIRENNSNYYISKIEGIRRG